MSLRSAIEDRSVPAQRARSGGRVPPVDRSAVAVVEGVTQAARHVPDAAAHVWAAIDHLGDHAGPVLGVPELDCVPHGRVRCATPTSVLGQPLAAGGAVPVQPGPEPRDVVIAVPRVAGLRLGLADRLDGRNPSLGWLRSRCRLEQRRARIQVPGGPDPRIGGICRRRRPADGSRDLHAIEEIRIRQVGKAWGT